MSPTAWRLAIATGVAGVWGFLCVFDAFSTSYVLDPSMHTGTGLILGTILGAEVASRIRNSRNRDRDGTDPE